MVDTAKTRTEGHAVSDELEATGVAGNGENTTTSGRTAVATRPLRPTGKRSRLVTEPVEAEPIEKAADKKDGGKAKTKTAKKTGPEKGRLNPIAFVWTYLQQVVAELRKVIWPNRKQMINYTGVVLFFLVFMVALIGVVDLGLAALVRGVFAGTWAVK
jgi:preprotein translocase subunit SecE